MRRFTDASATALAVLLAAGCDQRNPGGATAHPPAVASSTAASAQPLRSTAAPAIDSSAQAPRDANAWKGTYDAAKAKLDTPEKVPDVTWKHDPGEQAIGTGELALVVGADGAIRGTANGALGPQRLVGVLDGKSLRLAMIPEDATAPGAMTGTGVGDIEQGVARGTLRCAGPNGVVVRHATFELKPTS
ncbi:MAG: hypothetical protein MUF54_10740 [Polyangiaceae bacterium]|nr:hypothetical protein [Polyangiaceae bacterium]